ncbi:MAG: Ig-like domain-containing protein [Gemmatimonadetes bacterium]|nr:Ig-like domain-containing protein [Gemmatimonadota bacterium]
MMRSTPKHAAGGITTAVLRTLIWIAGCSDGGAKGSDLLGVEPYAVKGQFLELTPDVAALTNVGEQLSLTASVLDARGKVIPNARVQYHTTDPGIAMVDASGSVTGLGEGVAAIVGTSGAATDTAVVAVAAKKLEGGVPNIMVYPASDTLNGIGDVLQLRAVARNRGGRLLTNASFVWVSLNPARATVTQTGVVTGVGTGVAKIVVNMEEFADTATVTVAPPGIAARVVMAQKTDSIMTVGGTAQLSAWVVDGLGQKLNLTLTWSSLDGTIASVNAQGLVTGRAKGVARITAVYGSFADTARVWVAPTLVPASIDVQPDPDTIPNVGGTTQLIATVQDAGGNAITGATLTWASLDPSIVTVTNTGRVTGVKSGLGRVTAKINAIVDTAAVWVAPVQAQGVAAVKLTVSGSIDGAGQTLQVQASALDANGATISNAGVSWLSQDPSIITVSWTGNGQSAVLTGVKAGEARIKASSGGKADSAWVRVSNGNGGSGSGSAAKVDVTPAVDTIPSVGGTSQLSAKVVDGNGNTLTGQTVTWASLDAVIATVDSTGMVKSLKAGLARITAQHTTLKDTAWVYVAPSSVSPLATSVRITPQNTSIRVGNTGTLNGSVLDQLGQVMTSLNVTWSSLDPAIATINANGVVSALSVGTMRARAVYGQLADTAIVNVTAPAPAGGYSATSPHWRHVRVGATDYRIHYINPSSAAAAEWDWAAGHIDFVVGGSVDEYKRRNPSLQHSVYDLFWAMRQVDTPGMDQWLVANGYNVEAAYLHKAGTSKIAVNRVPATIWNSSRYLTNPGDPGFRAYKQSRATNMTALRPSGFRSDGLFIDELGTGVIQSALPATTLEYSSLSAYYTDFRGLISAVRQKTAGGFLVLNTAQYRSAEDLAQIAVSHATMTEFLNSPYGEAEPVWRDVEKMMNSGAVVQFATGVSSNTKNMLRYDMNGGNYSSIAERVLLSEYASYLMVVDPNRMDQLLFDTYGLDWTVPMITTWLKAFETDIGLAIATRAALKQGTDAVGQQYTVWMREFENALVVYRPMKNWSHKRYGDITGVDVTLPPGTWRMVMPDGSLTAPVSQVRLRNSEAAIFLK